MKFLYLILLCLLMTCSTAMSQKTVTPTDPLAPSASADIAPAATRPVGAGWMIGRSAIDRLQQASWPEEQIRSFFDNPNTYVMGKMPDGWQSISTLTFTSYAELEKQFNLDTIPESVRAIVYDNEHWQFSPIQEQQNFASFAKQAAELVHLHHRILIATPATNLVQTLDPTRSGRQIRPVPILGYHRRGRGGGRCGRDSSARV